MIAPWAKDEVAGANFGDARLDNRFAILSSTLGSRPNLSIPAACRGRAEMKAAYRFFDNGKVRFEKILEPHIAETKVRMAECPVVLMVQDSSEMDFTRPEQIVNGVGEWDGAPRGFVLHETQAFTPDGIPLGTARAETINRVDGVSRASAAEKGRKRKQTPIEDKESMRRLTGLREARRVAQDSPGAVQCVRVADGESDIDELFAEPRGERPVHRRIRGCQDRAIDGGQARRRRDEVLATPALHGVELTIRGREAKTAAEDRARRQNRTTRQAKVEVRATSLTPRPPHRHDRELPPVTVNVVLVREMSPPPGETPVEWIPVTTPPIDTPEQVRTIVEYDCARRCVGILFRTLKSGCRIERRRFEDIDRVSPGLGLCLIVAWRTLFVCRMGRSCPDLDCEAIFEPSEWKAEWMAVKRKKPPKQMPRLSEMVHLVASLWGTIERPESEPGTQTLWIGIRRMHDLARARDRFGPEAKIRVE